MAAEAWEMTFVGEKTTVARAQKIGNSQWVRVPPKQEEHLKEHQSKLYLGSRGIYLPYKLTDTFSNGYQRWKNDATQRVFFTRPTETHTMIAQGGYEVMPNRSLELSVFSGMTRDLLWSRKFPAKETLDGQQLLALVRASLLKSSKMRASQRLAMIETGSQVLVKAQSKYIHPEKSFKIQRRIYGKTPLAYMPVLSKFQHKRLVQQ